MSTCWWLVAVVCVAVAGCAQQRDPLAEAEAEPVVADTRAEAPGDFSVSVTVFSPSTTARTPPHRRAARYILEPDWVLRAAVGPGCTEATYPPAVRGLRAREVQGVWEMVRDAALTADGGSGRIASGAAYEAPEGSTAYLITTVADGVRRTFALDPSSKGGRAVVEHLARLSWNAR